MLQIISGSISKLASMLVSSDSSDCTASAFAALVRQRVADVVNQQEDLGDASRPAWLSSNDQDTSTEEQEQDIEHLGSGRERYQLVLLQSRIDGLDVLLDFLVQLDKGLSENVETESDLDVDIRMIMYNWRLQHGRKLTQKRITQEQLLCHYRTVNDMLRDVYRRKRAQRPRLDNETLRSFFLAEFRNMYGNVASYVCSLRRRVNLMKARIGNLAASEAPSTGGNAAQSERPADHFDVFDFAAIPFDRTAEMKAYIANYPNAMHESEIDKLRDAAFHAIFERGDKEQARDYVRHAVALCYASHAETVDGLHRLLTGISADRTQSRIEFERDVDWHMYRIDRAVWLAMRAEAAEAAQRARSEQPHPQEHTAVSIPEGGEADEDEQGRQDVFDASSQAMEGVLPSSSRVEEPHAGGDEGP
ncbi:hypothetical protein MY11210_003952 [Beauveria gryllotalpidicola]